MCIYIYIIIYIYITYVYIYIYLSIYTWRLYRLVCVTQRHGFCFPIKKGPSRCPQLHWVPTQTAQHPRQPGASVDENGGFGIKVSKKKVRTRSQRCTEFKKPMLFTISACRMPSNYRQIQSTHPSFHHRLLNPVIRSMAQHDKIQITHHHG